jgi:hypothetical protein
MQSKSEQDQWPVSRLTLQPAAQAHRLSAEFMRSGQHGYGDSMLRQRSGDDGFDQLQLAARKAATDARHMDRGAEPRGVPGECVEAALNGVVADRRSGAAPLHAVLPDHVRDPDVRGGRRRAERRRGRSCCRRGPGATVGTRVQARPATGHRDDEALAPAAKVIAYVGYGLRSAGLRARRVASRLMMRSGSMQGA